MPVRHGATDNNPPGICVLLYVDSTLKDMHGAACQSLLTRLSHVSVVASSKALHYRRSVIHCDRISTTSTACATTPPAGMTRPVCQVISGEFTSHAQSRSAQRLLETISAVRQTRPQTRKAAPFRVFEVPLATWHYTSQL